MNDNVMSARITTTYIVNSSRQLSWTIWGRGWSVGTKSSSNLTECLEELANGKDPLAVCCNRPNPTQQYIAVLDLVSYNTKLMGASH